MLSSTNNHRRAGEDPRGSIPVRGEQRRWELDAARGLAIALMLVDHVAYLVGVPEVRLTLGRLAMPLFFLLAGPLVSRLTPRHALAACLGLLLPLAAPWVDSPNVLLVYALGCVVIVLMPARAHALVVVVPLVVLANRWSVGSSGYDPAALIGLMALGRLIGLRWALELGARLPHFLAVVGRAPLRWYVGNVLLIQGVVLWLSKV